MLDSLRAISASFWRHAMTLHPSDRRTLAAGWENFAGALCLAENGYLPPTDEQRTTEAARSCRPVRVTPIASGEYAQPCSPEVGAILCALLAARTTLDPATREAARAAGERLSELAEKNRQGRSIVC